MGSRGSVREPCLVAPGHRGVVRETLERVDASGDDDVTAAQKTANNVFDVLRRHVAPGVVLAAKMAGQSAVDAEANGAAVRLSNGREAIASAWRAAQDPPVVTPRTDTIARNDQLFRITRNYRWPISGPPWDTTSRPGR